MTKYHPPTKRKQYLRTSKYDCSKYDYPETSFEFYDAFHSNSMTKSAILENTISTHTNTLEKYLSLCTTEVGVWFLHIQIIRFNEKVFLISLMRGLRLRRRLYHQHISSYLSCSSQMVRGEILRP